MLGRSCLQLCPPRFYKQSLPTKQRVLLTTSSARKRGFIAMEAFIIQFKWDFFLTTSCWNMMTSQW